MPWQGIPLEEALPACERGDTFTVDEIKLVEKHTSPPDYLTEAELITLMEKHGIGKQQPCLLEIVAVCTNRVGLLLQFVKSRLLQVLMPASLSTSTTSARGTM